MKKSELVFNLLSVPADVFFLFLAGIAAFYLRIHLQQSQLVGPVAYTLPLLQFIKVLLMIIPVLILGYALLGLYNLKGTRGFIFEISRISLGSSLGLLFVIILFFFDHTIFPSRFIILGTWLFAIVFVWIGRLILKLIQQWFFKRGYGLHRLIIVNGINEQSKHILNRLRDKTFGYKVVAELDYGDQVLEKLEALYYEKGFDEVLQTNPSLSDAQSSNLVEFARNKGLGFSFVPNFYNVQKNSVEYIELGGTSVISLKNTPLDGWGKVVKRLFDILASGACLVLTSPIFLAIYIAIKLDSPGKVIYAAPRGGRGKDFRFYKFRSMYTHLSVGDEYGGNDAEAVRIKLWENNDRGGAEGPFLKIKQDPRVTRVGRFLRKSKLDELPQFWNVLKGDMSMVGPRAHVIDEVERYRNRYRRMFSIKPGIFGVSQLAQMSWPDLPFEEEIKLNTLYIEHWNLWWDVKILVKTFYQLFFGTKPQDDY